VPAVALAAPGSGASTTTAARSTAETAAAAAAKCGARQLTAWLGLPAEGGAGTFHYQLELSNTSSRACTLDGFPGGSARDASGQLGSPALRDHSHPVKLITVGPGGTAHFELGITNVDAFPNPKCKAVTASELRVYPPNDTNSVFVSFTFRACSVKGAKYL